MDRESQCEKLKQEGNQHLKANNYEAAINLYTQSITLAQSNEIKGRKIAVYYANRAYAQIKLDSYGLAIIDAQKAIQADPKYEKGYWRLGFCKQISQHFKEAYGAYKKAFELSGNKDEFIYGKLLSCKKQNQEHMRNRKMQMLNDDKERGPKIEKVYKNWREIEVGKQYTGQRLEEQERPTAQWVIKLMQDYKEQKSLHKRYTLQLIQQCKEIVNKYQNVVEYSYPPNQDINVCGDIHGQYYDVLNLMKINGYPSQNNRYLFNGDFVDRGSFSVECIMTLIAWKCVDTQSLHMVRGNHQARQVNTIYGFKGQVEAKFKDNSVYEAFCQLFCCLPLAYILNSKVMVCHGGLPSTDNVTIAQIQQLNRKIQPPQSGIMCDLLWADPIPSNGRSPSKRGVSMGFGPDITKAFLKLNNLKTLIRSHEVKQEGYEEAHDGQCITIFSAPNYCDCTGNMAAFIKLKGEDMKPKFTQFKAEPHPNIGPMAYANQFRGMI